VSKLCTTFTAALTCVLLTALTPSAAELSDATPASLTTPAAASAPHTAPLAASRVSVAAANVASQGWTRQTRARKNRPDTRAGYQIQAVYVVPSNGTDMRRDVSGQVSSWMRQGVEYLDRELGDSWQIDTARSGKPDVRFLASRFTRTQLSRSSFDTSKLLREIGEGLPTGKDRKTYVFFIETAQLSSGLIPEGVTCGYAGLQSRAVRVATGTDAARGCSASTPDLSGPARTWVHEVMHTLGVLHVDDPGDLMHPIDKGQPASIDRQRALYVDAAAAGVDIRSLRVWASRPTNASAAWACLREGRTQQAQYLCGLGPSQIQPIQAQCWTTAEPSILEVRSGDTWIRQGAVAAEVSRLCPAGFPYSYAPEISRSQAGVETFRLTRASWSSAPFRLAFQR
jgi:hypothetical protein